MIILTAVSGQFLGGEMVINEHVISGLLKSSHHLEGQFIFPITSTSLYEDSPKFKASDSLGLISIEHAASLRFLIAHAKCNTSAFALFRLQYEALVKGFWSLYVANDEQLDLIVGELSNERAERNNKELPSISKMLIELKNANSPAQQAVEMLIQFKDISWKALNSFVHSGVHAVYRSTHGYPDELVFTIIRQSNNLMHLAAYMLAVITGDQRVIENVKQTARNFKDCFQE